MEEYEGHQPPQSTLTDGIDSFSRQNNQEYECFAPPGPLGVIIDTTSNGPMVHSIKPTSQLLGIIHSGDFVIALDDIDTSAMTAPLLTRLMASKSQQPQRKITLLRRE